MIGIKLALALANSELVLNSLPKIFFKCLFATKLKTRESLKICADCTIFCKSVQSLYNAMFGVYRNRPCYKWISHLVITQIWI